MYLLAPFGGLWQQDCAEHAHHRQALHGVRLGEALLQQRQHARVLHAHIGDTGWVVCITGGSQAHKQPAAQVGEDAVHGHLSIGLLVQVLVQVVLERRHQLQFKWYNEMQADDTAMYGPAGGPTRCPTLDALSTPTNKAADAWNVAT